MGEQTIKNIAQPVRAYRVLHKGKATANQVAPSTQAGRSIPAATRSATTIGSQPLVGRDREVSFLRERLDSALQGNGSVVFVTGQAGIGKTRLAREVRNHAVGMGCQWLDAIKASFNCVLF